MTQAARVVLLGISWGVLALVVGLGLVTIGLPLATRSVPLTILTGSMEPVLPPGTLLVSHPVQPAEVRLGDVLTYHPAPGEAKLISHRVVAIRSISDGSLEFVTKGDANDVADPAPVTEPQVVGTTWYSVPWVGHLSTMLSGHGGWLRPLLGAGALTYAAVQVVLGVRAARRRRTRQPNRAIPGN